MALDSVKNFSKVVVSTGYNDSATTVVLSGGMGAKLPAVPFNAVWYNSTDYPDPSDDPNVEIVRVTDVSTDTLTVTRAQESTAASAKNLGGKTYQMIAGLTAKTIGDIGAIFDDQDTNTFYAGPASGSADAPTFRAVTVNDVAHIRTAGAITGVQAQNVLYNEVLMENPSLIGVSAINMTAGTADIYTVPSGKAAFFSPNQAFFSNSTGSSISTGWRFKKSGGSYFQLSTTNVGIAANAGGVNSFSGSTSIPTALLGEGDTIGFNMSADGASMWLRIVEFTPVSITSIYHTPTGGDDTIFTVPTGKKYLVVAQHYFNASGGARTISMYAVPPSGSPATVNAIRKSANVNNNNSTGGIQSPTGIVFMAGESLVFSSDANTADQLYVVRYVEV